MRIPAKLKRLAAIAVGSLFSLSYLTLATDPPATLIREHTAEPGLASVAAATLWLAATLLGLRYLRQGWRGVLSFSVAFAFMLAVSVTGAGWDPYVESTWMSLAFVFVLSLGLTAGIGLILIPLPWERVEAN